VLYREVCYRRIAPGRKVKLHRGIGQWAEAHLERVDEAAAWLAGHFEQGGDWLRAIKYLKLAADTAGRRFAPQQAAEILEHALSLVKKLRVADRTAHETMILEKLAAIYLAWVSKATDRIVVSPSSWSPPGSVDLHARQDRLKTEEDGH